MLFSIVVGIILHDRRLCDAAKRFGCLLPHRVCSAQTMRSGTAVRQAQGAESARDWCLWDRLPVPDREGQVECRSDSFICHTSIQDIHGGRKPRIFLTGGMQAVVGDPQYIRKRDIAERIGAGAAHSSRHVGDAIVQNPFNNVGGAGMSCRAGCFQTTALIDTHIDDDRTGFHQLQVIGRYQLRELRESERHRSQDPPDEVVPEYCDGH